MADTLPSQTEHDFPLTQPQREVVEGSLIVDDVPILDINFSLKDPWKWTYVQDW